MSTLTADTQGFRFTIQWYRIFMIRCNVAELRAHRGLKQDRSRTFES
jgi:hypothetical protein